MAAKKERNILVVYLSSPASVGKSALMLTLKYLRREGWYPTVITLPREDNIREPATEWFGIDIIVPDQFKSRLWRLSRVLYRARARCSRRSHLHSKTTYISLPGLLSALANYLLLPAALVLSFPDRYRHTVPGVLKTAKQLHQDRQFQAVLSIYDPMSSHLVARRLSEEEHLPWIALTKDYYSKPVNIATSKVGLVKTWFKGRYVKGVKEGLVKNWFKGRYERRVLSKCVTVLAVYDDLAQHLRELLPATDVKVLTHCYDDDHFEKLEACQGNSGGIFRVLWLGTVHGFDRESLRVFFAALGELVKEGVIDPSSFRARFVGPGFELARSFAAGTGCEGLLEMVPSVPHDEAMKELKQATCLLFTQVHIGGRRRLPEFIATRKPILVYPPEHGNTMSDRVLQSYGAAAIVEADCGAIKSTLTQWYRQFQVQGTLEFPVKEEIVRSFSASQVAATLDRVLLEATATISTKTFTVRVASSR